MSRITRVVASTLLALALATATGCAKKGERGGIEPANLEPPETFSWVAQPITFSPPSGPWERQGDNSGGTLGVRFILTDGGGQCISVAAYRWLAERDRREALKRLISRRDSLSRHEFLRELSLARARTDEPISEREAMTAREINTALDQAMTNYLAERTSFVASDLDDALRAASSYEPTLADILPHVRLIPARMPNPNWWRIGYERDTTFAGRPAFASDDTIITPERPLLYREIFWVVHGCAFKAVYQGTTENLKFFYRLVDSIQFPEKTDAASR